MAAMDGLEQTYKSPVRKLLAFFEKSRDGWKTKHHETKLLLKKEQNQVRAVEKSRESWRSRAEDAARRVRELETELAEIKRESAATGR